jgi:hypothetical protein
MSGRPHALTYPKIRRIDVWRAQPTRFKSPPWKIMAHQMGISIRTLYNVCSRSYGYASVPRRLDKGSDIA